VPIRRYSAQLARPAKLPPNAADLEIVLMCEVPHRPYAIEVLCYLVVATHRGIYQERTNGAPI
jgi:hypothetical protein